MLDVALIRKQPDVVRRGLADKGETADLDWFLQQDKEFREIVHELNGMRAQQNKLTPVIGQKKRDGEDASEELARVAELKNQQRQMTERKDQLEADLKRILMRMPNLCAPDVPVGQTDAENVVDATWGEPPEFEFEPKPHWDVGEDLGLLHPKKAAGMSGAGFSLITGGLAQMERALWNYMLDLHTREHGYTEVLVPYLVRPESMEASGQLPKFEADMYRCRDSLRTPLEMRSRRPTAISYRYGTRTGLGTTNACATRRNAISSGSMTPTSGSARTSRYPGPSVNLRRGCRSRLCVDWGTCSSPGSTA